jgi:hypothetical protein
MADNESAYEQANSQGGVTVISPKNAEKLLEINGFATKDANSWVGSFSGTIYLVTATALLEGISEGGGLWRYFGPTSITGYVVADRYYTSSCDAIVSLALPPKNQAEFRAEATPDADWTNAWFLAGDILHGAPDVYQVMGYDVHEWLYGQPVQLLP